MVRYFYLTWENITSLYTMLLRQDAVGDIIAEGDKVVVRALKKTRIKKTLIWKLNHQASV